MIILVRSISIPTTLSMPRMKSIMKNRKPQNCGKGRNETAMG